jgi:hypothetical protein
MRAANLFCASLRVADFVADFAKADRPVGPNCWRRLSGAACLS